MRRARSRAARAGVRVASGSASRWSSGWSASSRRPSRSSPRPTCAWPGSARSPTGASRSSTPTRARSGSAARSGRPQFGYKARVADTAEGFVIADIPERGGADRRQPPRRRDREGETVGDAAALGLRRPRLRHQHRRRRARQTRDPRRGDTRGSSGPRRASTAAPGDAATAIRNGLEGRISQLKRKGLRRTRLRSLEGAQTWVGGIALAHNLQRMALLT